MTSNVPGKYAASTLDTRRIRAYARRVARETTTAPAEPLTKCTQVYVPVVKIRSVGFLGLKKETYTAHETHERSIEVVGSHWVLFSTRHFITQGKCKRHKAYEYEETNSWVLATNGELLKVWQWGDFTLFNSGVTKRESDCTVRAMTEDDILELDHDHKFTHYEDRSGHYRGDRQAGRIVRHAKGVGLSLKLKQLL
ncbi:hypothetical protein GIY30_02325 [Gordonia sp. HNM0687]|uniref:Uncharacterized protein n=2 Tax=Gordonia TaxID=2053 RepID=A0A6L7GLB6_9ACTN|nr:MULTISPECIES: hypothetical protein [Gordonia]MCX2966842.1 hypothetical protein [Gordonia aquimaris]MXP20207.1 hypothetical protein [Gordonia mangrovi]UVF79185.1 hypothetical protein NWF22_04910 [Gordonia mangrovi]